LRWAEPKNTKPSPAGSAEEGFRCGVVGLAAEGPLSRPGKEQAQEVSQQRSPTAHDGPFLEDRVNFVNAEAMSTIPAPERRQSQASQGREEWSPCAQA